MSGTSIASPHVAGAAAVLLSDGKTVTLEALAMKNEIISGVEKPMCQFSCRKILDYHWWRPSSPIHGTDDCTYAMNLSELIIPLSAINLII